MKKDKNNRKILIALIGLLSIIILALASYLIYYSFISDDYFCKGPICHTINS